MKKASYNLLGYMMILLVMIFSGGCGQMSGGAEEKPAGKSSGGRPASENMSEAFKGTVMETIDAGRYAYVRVDTGQEMVWVAVPAFDGKPGDRVVVPPGVPMADFRSRTLNREFKMIYFVGAILKEGERMEDGQTQKLPGNHPPAGGREEKMIHPPMGEISPTPAVEAGTVKKAEGGHTVSEIITGRKSLAGSRILLRAKVVRFTPDIMDRNWLHLKDGSGGEGTSDLIVTTDAAVTVGDVVLVRGTVSVDRDFGFGLVYPVIIEDAEVAVE